MIAQTISFQLLGLTEDQAKKHCDTYAFAVPEFDGLQWQHWFRRFGSNRYVATLTWDSAASLAAFRRSELYARLALDPHIGRMEDDDCEVIDDACQNVRRRQVLLTAA